jgi:hypothetical protein
MAKGGKKQHCKAEGCNRHRVGWGYCGLHYQRLIRSGDVQPTHRSQARAETMAADGTRKCYRCGERKPFDSDHFPADGRRRGGELKGTCKSCARSAVWRSTLARYGISESEFNALAAAQDNRCAICSLQFDDSRKSSLPHIDHCHRAGKVRGLLCHHCNVLLGHAADSVQRLRQAIQYLERADANP